MESKKKTGVLRGFSDAKIDTLFFFIILSEFSYGTGIGSLNCYFELELKELGLSNSNIEVFLVMTSLGGIFSGFIYNPLLTKFNKERIFLIFSFISAFSFVGLGAFTFFSFITDSALTINVTCGIFLVAGGFGRSAILNFGAAFATEAYPSSIAKKAMMIYGSFMVGMSVGPFLLVPLYIFFGYSSVFITIGTLVSLNCAVIYSLSPKYPPKLQMEKARKIEDESQEVHITNWMILTQPTVLTYIVLYIQIWGGTRVLALCYSLYLVEEFEMSNVIAIVYSLVPSLFGTVMVFLNYMLLNFFKPISITFWLSLITTVGFFLCAANLLLTNDSFLLSMVGACMAIIGAQLIIYSVQITLSLATESLQIEPSYAVRDKVANIISTSIFISLFIGSCQSSVESFFIGFNLEMLLEGVLCIFFIGLFFKTYFGQRRQHLNGMRCE